MPYHSTTTYIILLALSATQAFHLDCRAEEATQQHSQAGGNSGNTACHALLEKWKHSSNLAEFPVADAIKVLDDSRVDPDTAYSLFQLAYKAANVQGKALNVDAMGCRLLHDAKTSHGCIAAMWLLSAAGSHGSRTLRLLSGRLLSQNTDKDERDYIINTGLPDLMSRSMITPDEAANAMLLVVTCQSASPECRQAACEGITQALSLDSFSQLSKTVFDDIQDAIRRAVMDKHEHMVVRKGLLSAATYTHLAHGGTCNILTEVAEMNTEKELRHSALTLMKSMHHQKRETRQRFVDCASRILERSLAENTDDDQIVISAIDVIESKALGSEFEANILVRLEQNASLSDEVRKRARRVLENLSIRED